MSTTNFSLVALILNDLTRNPLRVLLYLCVIVSALAVILSSHLNRQMAINYEQLIQQKDQLDIEWRHLVLEQSALSEHNRIELTVKEQLAMRRPSPEQEKVVRLK